jgi:hypothetical protein
MLENIAKRLAIVLIAASVTFACGESKNNSVDAKDVARVAPDLPTEDDRPAVDVADAGSDAPGSPRDSNIDSNPMVGKDGSWDGVVPASWIS